MNENKSEKIYEGDIKISKENEKEWKKKLEYTEKITGSVYVRESATFTAPKLTKSGSVDVRESATFTAPKLTEVSGYVYVRNGDEKLEKQLWKIASKNKWYVSDKSSEWLLSQKGNFAYKINQVELPKEWFDKIRKDELTAEEVFAIDNVEHRRIAFEKMDKAKMKALKDFKILDEQTDAKGNPMKILSFTVQNMKTPLKFYNCVCPSSKREYFIGTDKETCLEAKAACWGFKTEEIEFVEEW